MNDKEQDPSLQAPQEANTTKHINFLAAEDDANTTDEEATDDKDSFANSPTRKAWQELRDEESSAT